MKTQIKPANFGSVSHGTLRTNDLLSAFIDEMQWQMQRNSSYFSLPENFHERDCLHSLIGEAQDCFAENGEDIDADKEETAAELVNDFCDRFSDFFCKRFAYFGTHCGDGSDFGFWPDIDAARDFCGFVSTKESEYPANDFVGEWLHINERGNCTLYVRDESGKDSELWSVV